MITIRENNHTLHIKKSTQTHIYIHTYTRILSDKINKIMSIVQSPKAK